MKPKTKGTQQPYIEKYVGMRDPNSGVAFVSPATVFVSHAWRYAFYSVVVDVMEQHAAEHPNAYFWFDLFSNDQNEVASKDFDWFSSTFRNSIRGIGEVLLVLSPWDKPIPICRAWCLYEIHNALDEPNVGLSIHLPTREVRQLRDGVIKNSKCVIQALSDIQAEKAQAKVESDRQLIFEVIQRSEGGFANVNKEVKNGLREWYIQQLQLLIEQEPSNSMLRMHTANVMKVFGFLDEALLHYDNSIGQDVQKLGGNHLDVAASYNNIANGYYEKGDMDKALQYQNASLSIMRMNLGRNHPDMAEPYNNIANVYCEKGDLDRALEFYNKSLAIKLITLGGSHPKLVHSYNNIAAVFDDKGDHDQALHFYNKSLSIGLRTLGESDPFIADVYENIGMLYDSERKYEAALLNYEKAYDIRADVLGPAHQKSQKSLQMIARINIELKNGNEDW